MTYFKNVAVDEDNLKKWLQDSWDVELGSLIKASQNHTYMGKKRNGEQCIVRITPDDGSRRDSFDLEARFLKYLKLRGLPVCQTIEDLTGRYFLYKDGLCIMVFEYATGQVVKLTDWKWMERQHVVDLGKWLGKFHDLSRAFTEERKGIRMWSDIHDGILKHTDIHPSDVQAASDVSKFGIIHGDVNISNYFYSGDEVCMFDWDQMQKGWFLYDLSSPIWTVVSMKYGGNPVDKSPVPHANPEEFTDWLIEGYESVCLETVDREVLDRMLKLRRFLYKEFCTKALHQVDLESEMGQFMTYMLSWL
jgi:Ser/Thr protein kinase RdoA (MazF antagonist)